MGYSLGSLLFLLLDDTWNQQLKSKILLAAPSALVLSARSLTDEAKSLLHPQFWQRARDVGFVQLLPAVGWFKRRQFPVRLEDPRPNYVTQFAALIADCHTRLPRAPLHPRELFIFGSEDTFSGGDAARDLFTRLHPHAQVCTVPGENHYTLLLSTATEQHVLTWVAEN